MFSHEFANIISIAAADVIELDPSTHEKVNLSYRKESH
jgi:hypothetical protein